MDEVTFPHLSAEERGQLQSCLQEYAGLFANGDLDMGSTDVLMHTIDTGDHPAIRQPPRHIPFALRCHVEKMIRQMEEQEVIQPSKSLWASLIVLVVKKDKTTRFCVDYRKLNAITKMAVYSLPRIDDSLDLLSGQQFYTTLDLASGYWQDGGCMWDMSAFVYTM